MYSLTKGFAALILAAALAPSLASAQSSDVEIEEIQVLGVRARLEQAGVLKDVIERTEIVGATQIEQTRSISLSEALGNSAGADVSIDCSLCGMKRVRLNGLRADQTTILVDGLPSHTIFSGFYGIDAVATTGIQEIEVARGAGASMLTPEAIGGVVNIVTIERPEDSLALDISAGEEGFQQFGALGTLSLNDGDTRITAIAQIDERDQSDEDGNGVSENPYLKNESYTLRASHDLSWTDNITARISHVEQESFGGPVLGDTVSGIGASFDTSAGESDAYDLFANGDVGGRWTGNPWETTEWVETVRDEASLVWLHEFDSRLNMELAYSYSKHEQDSFYEGFDYTATDEMNYQRAIFNYFLSDEHLLTFGADRRDEDMDSTTVAGAASPNFVADDFSYDVTAIFAADTWELSESLEVITAIRVDQVEANFLDPSKPGTEIDETIVSPRVDARYTHNEEWVSRFSAGRGYRAPLSFFETDHGLLEDGFAVEVEDLERSTAFGYTLSFLGERMTTSTSFAWTSVDNLAVLGEEVGTGLPLLDQLDEESRVTAIDFSGGFLVTDNLTLELVAEKYFYDDNFRSAYGIAPVEEAITLSADVEVAGWDLYGTLNWVGSRDLNDYGYEGYDLIDAAGNIDLASEKTLDAPSYYTLDLRIAKVFDDRYTVYFGGNNLLDYTQAGDEGSPLFWVNDGAGANDGFDVVYLHGPLRGRELYAGVTLEF